jgi:glycosyltransferase involved in cell wall biosynthesis
VFPSFYEGFGFPSLEAGIFGIPTIGANQSSIPEIAGKGGIYFDPFSTEDISKKIQRILSDAELYQEVSKNALTNIENFSWNRNARETLEIYNKVGRCNEKK